MEDFFANQAAKSARKAANQARKAANQARKAANRARKAANQARKAANLKEIKKPFSEENYKGVSMKDLICACPEIQIEINIIRNKSIYKLKTIKLLEQTDIGKYFAVYWENPECIHTMLAHILFIGKGETKWFFDTIYPRVVPQDFITK
jgi:hypothetical protein